MNDDSEPEWIRSDSEARFSVVGVGASAGGLDAFRLLLSHLPADTGLAIVLIQHLDPAHKSSLSELLGRVARMPAGDASDGQPVEPNHIYVIPPNTELTIANRVLQVSPRRAGLGPHMPIDRFLRSLAQDCGNQAIGVILSGAGSDGSLGLQAVKEAGGVTFAQDPGTAEFASMPRMAAAANCVDYILPPAGIAVELARIARSPHFVLSQPAERETPLEDQKTGLGDILAVMRETTGIDFSLNREGTVQRRIMRRLALRNIDGIEKYAALLKKDAGERSLLKRDLLIGVTKEELQSAYEELLTINRELESKNATLTQARNFAMSMVGRVRMPLLVLDRDIRIMCVNEAFSQTFQVPRRDAEGELLDALGGGNWNIPGLRERLDRVLSAGESFDNFEVEWEFPSAGTRDWMFSGHKLEHPDLILVGIDDITARKQAEKVLHKTQDALRQAETTEAIGRLAGGIAHDFNNLLTAIIGYNHLVADTLGGDHQAIEYVQEIESASQRAAALTDQLLSFSRRKVLQPKVFDLTMVVAGFEKMLRRIVGEHIKVVVRTAPDLWPVRADAGEMGRALMNLCLNARDAMPTGGTLTILTENVTLDQADSARHNVSAGDYVELVVRDTGIGMDPETQAHVFEAFFTTKETSKGTGLGLATVLGIVEQSGGAIWCQSELGQGAGFTIVLPAAEAAPEVDERPPGAVAEAPRGAAEVVLLVEDEDRVRKLTSTILQERGYVVLEARDGIEALSVCESTQEKIDLLVSDVVMPELGGRELSERILAMRPEIKVLFMSGHTQDVILKEGIMAGTPFLQKPFAPTGLARKVREVLNSQRKAGGQPAADG